MKTWTPCSDNLPPRGQIVETKIDDGGGCRNVSLLKRNHRLWWLPDGSMYVYYTPTHWRPAELAEVEATLDRSIASHRAEVDRLEKEKARATRGE